MYSSVSDSDRDSGAGNKRGSVACSASMGAFGVFSVNDDDDTDRQESHQGDHQEEQTGEPHETDALVNRGTGSSDCNWWQYAPRVICCVGIVGAAILGGVAVYLKFTDHKHANQPGGVLSDGNLHPVSAANATDYMSMTETPVSHTTTNTVTITYR